MIYNAVFVSVYSKVNQSYMYIYPLFFGSFSYIGHYRAVSRVLCAIQEILRQQGDQTSPS